MRRRLLPGAVFLCTLLAAARTSYADPGDYLGRPIASVRFVIEGREVAEPAVVQLAETRVGRPLSMADVRLSVAHLFSLGRFEDVRVDATADAAGVALVYDLVPVHPVTKMIFSGDLNLPGVDVGELRRAVVDRYGASPPLSRTADMTRIIADILQERGYRHAVITPHAELEHAPDRATLVFTIQPGGRTFINEVTVVGSADVPSDEFARQLGVVNGAPYLQDVLDQRIQRYIEARRKRGYYAAKIVATVRYADDERSANVTVSVTPGAHGRIVFAGDPLPADKRDELIPIEQEGSVDEDLLEDSSNRMEEYLRGQGYRDATVRHTREQSGNELLITFTVRKGPWYQVARLEVSGNVSVPRDELEGSLRSRDAEGFSNATLSADVRSIEQMYRRRGFSAAKAQATVTNGSVTPNYVAVTIRVEIVEGVRTVVSVVNIEGNASVPDAALRTALGLQPGRPYFDPQLRADGDAIQLAYANRGYPNATVETAANFSADRTTASPVFKIREGVRVFIDHVLIVGNIRTSNDTIERALQVRSGDALSAAAVGEARRRLAALGLFRRYDITELRHGEETKRDLLVTVQEAPATTVDYGGGIAVRQRVLRSADDPNVASQKLEVAPRASFLISRRNLFGKNRSLSLFTNLTLYPSDSPVFSGQAPVTNSEFGFPEYRVIGTYREPRVFDTLADASVTGFLEQGIRSSFNFARKGASIEVARRLTSQISVSGSYQLQSTRRFDDQVAPQDRRDVDRLFPQVRLSSFLASAVRDTRDDGADPVRGKYLSVNGQFAARIFGSEVGFTKVFLNGQLFQSLRTSSRVVFAGSARLGLAAAYPRAAILNGVSAVVEDLPASERFFAGGDTTVRGYALDTLTTPATRDDDGFPTGGTALIILNAEVRASIWKALGAVVFVDAGNVFKSPGAVDLGDMRGSVGVGVRYKSPVGPIRIDVGFKLKRDIIAGNRESLTALHISLGQAF